MPMIPPTHRPAHLPSRAEARRAYDDKRRVSQAWRKWYSTARWKAIRAAQLARQPLCEMCLAKGLLNDGSRRLDGAYQTDRRRRFLVCDHIYPHRGEARAFWMGPFQTLCPDHHDSVKQGEEGRGYSVEAGLDGWPIDPKHPANR